MTEPIPIRDPNLWLLHGADPSQAAPEMEIKPGWILVPAVSISVIIMIALLTWIGFAIGKHLAATPIPNPVPVREVVAPTPVSLPEKTPAREEVAPDTPRDHNVTAPVKAGADPQGPSLQTETDRIWQEWAETHQPKAKATDVKKFTHPVWEKKLTHRTHRIIEPAALAPEAMKCPASVCFP